MKRALVVAGLACVLCGCATVTQLNDPARSVEGPDFATVGSADEGVRLWEVQAKDGVEVAYNITRSNDEEFTLRLTFRNLLSQTIDISPVVRIYDASGGQIYPYDYETVMMMASMQARTPIPSMPSQGPTSYYHSGTIRDLSTGSTYWYDGTSSARSSFSAGFAQGQAMGAVIAAAIERRAGLEKMNWISTYWLRARYSIDPGKNVGGVLIYPASVSKTKLPLMIKVSVNGVLYEFVTVESK